MRRLKFWDYVTFSFFGIVAVLLCFWADTAVRDYVASRKVQNMPVSPPVPRTRAVSPVQVNIYVYRAEDVSAVLQAARKGLPELAGAEGVGR